MPSITTWARLEPRARRRDDLRLGLQARFMDPMWAIARQAMMGEFQAENSGSPVIASVTVNFARLSAYRAGDPQPADPGHDAIARTAYSIFEARGRAEGHALDDWLIAERRLRGPVSDWSYRPPPSQPFDPATTPLEILAERMPVERGAGASIRLAVEAGLHFCRLLKAAKVPQYIPRYCEVYPLPLVDEGIDPETARYLSVMSGRVPHGGQLRDDLAQTLPAGLPNAPAIDAADASKVLAIAGRWADWFDQLFSDRPKDVSSWDSATMEHRFAVAGRFQDGLEVTLTAERHVAGRVDWDSFDARSDLPLGAAAQVDTLTKSFVPSSVSFAGMPAPRWWQFEDSAIDFGGIPAGPMDLPRMVLVEFALLYGNDWHIVPLELPIGTLASIATLTVTDSFGQSTHIEHYRTVDGDQATWRMFSLTDKTVASGGRDLSKLLLLAPTLAGPLEAPPIEEVLLTRDEGADMSWAIERTIESGVGKALNRLEAYLRRRQQEPPPSSTAGAGLVYRFATEVPDYWIPLLPVETQLAANRQSRRLRPGLMRPLQGSLPAIPAEGSILAEAANIRMFDHEIPREGSRVTRSYAYARWSDGSVHCWNRRQKAIGRGEGASGLEFDVIERGPG